jgi:hypothetical protein
VGGQVPSSQQATPPHAVVSPGVHMPHVLVWQTPLQQNSPDEQQLEPQG